MLDHVKAWHEEHVYFQRLLHLLQRELDAFHAGEAPNYPLMRDIVLYLREWGDRYHHPREDEAFRRLVARRPDRKLPVARLEQEHRVIAACAESLLRVLDAVLAGNIVPKGEVELAAATYLVYFGNHIAKEEEDILPLAATLLSPSDWAAARDAAPPAQDPLFGPAPEERYRDLRRQIELEAA